ncbi:MAG: hypothetical protein QM765_53480 [Myxococcales bacterium]
MHRAIGLGLLLAASSGGSGCASYRVRAPLASDPIVDWHRVPLTGWPTARGPTSDEEVARAIHLLLEGRLADLTGACVLGLELIEAAAKIAPDRPLDWDRREHSRQCEVGFHARREPAAVASVNTLDADASAASSDAPVP